MSLFVRNTAQSVVIDGHTVPVTILSSAGVEFEAVRPPYAGGGYVAMSDLHLLSGVTL